MPTDGMVDDYTPNTLNQYTEIENNPVQHDLNGNLVSYKTGTYTYNAHNRMTRAEIGSKTIVLAYDPDGRLSKSIVDGTATEFLYDGDELIAEYDNNGNLLRRYIHGAGVDDPQVVIEADGTKRWLHADERGSIVAETDATGGLVVTHSYDPYGNPGNTSASRFRYTGQILIPGTEANALYYYKARVYHPRIGRFMQTDPLGYKDGMNWYAYVQNDPINNVDPTGMCTGSRICRDGETVKGSGYVIAGAGIAGAALQARAQAGRDSTATTSSDPQLEAARQALLNVDAAAQANDQEYFMFGGQIDGQEQVLSTKLGMPGAGSVEDISPNPPAGATWEAHHHGSYVEGSERLSNDDLMTTIIHAKNAYQQNGVQSWKHYVGTPGNRFYLIKADWRAGRAKGVLLGPLDPTKPILPMN